MNKIGVLAPQPVLPPEYQYYRDIITPVHNRLAQMSLDDIWKSLPPLETGPGGTRYAIFNPPGITDPEQLKSLHTILAPHTAQNGRGAQWGARIAYVIGAIKKHSNVDVRVLSLPSTTSRWARGEKNPTKSHVTNMNAFNVRELRQIAEGDNTPYALRHAAIVDKIGATSVGGFGMSMGGSILMSDVKYIADNGIAKVTDFTCIDPATLHGDTTKNKMKLNYIKNISNFHDAVRDSALPPYTVAQNSRYSSFIRQAFGSLGAERRDRKIPEIVAQREGMTHGNFQLQLHEFTKAYPDVAVGVGLGKDGGITELDDELSIGVNTKIYDDLPYGHAITNHLGLFSILTALTFQYGKDLRAVREDHHYIQPLRDELIQYRDTLGMIKED